MDTDTLGRINTTVNTIVDGVGALATLASYFGNLQLTLAVTSGIVVGTGLLLAFSLKEDRFDVKAHFHEAGCLPLLRNH